MSASRVLSLIVLTSLSWCLSMPFTARTSSRRPAYRFNEYFAEATTNEARLSKRNHSAAILAAGGSGVKEEIPAKYLKRYQDWKDEFLATATGRAQWQGLAEQAQIPLN